MNIIDLVHFDVCFILKKFNEQIENKRLQTLVIKSNREVINTSEFTDFIESNDIKNLTRIKDILDKAVLIVQLYNDALEKIEIGNKKYDIHCPEFERISINNKEIIYSNTLDVSESDFLLNSGYRPIHNQAFALKCASLINIITAFYKDLKTSIDKKLQNSTIPKSPLKEVEFVAKANHWEGTTDQKDKLFDELANQLFIERKEENRMKFLNNNIVQWKTDGRTLFYLLEELKRKPYKFLQQSLNLVPFISQNFVDKKGFPFRNVNQNKSGTNINKNCKPKQGKIIDEILKSLYTPLP